MLTRLKCNGVGCRIGLYFIGALAYTDDVVLRPSRKGLQEMLSLCEIFGDEDQLSFNTKMTHYIKLSHKNTNDQYVVKLNDNLLKWENSVDYLGNMLDQMLKDRENIRKKK